MTDKLRQAAEMALKALKNKTTIYVSWDDGVVEATEILEEALTQALAEPDMGIDRGAWSEVPDATKWVDELRGDEPQRDWVGLTDEEIAELRRNGLHSVSDADFRAIEAKLKEKNT